MVPPYLGGLPPPPSSGTSWPAPAITRRSLQQKSPPSNRDERLASVVPPTLDEIGTGDRFTPRRVQVLTDTLSLFTVRDPMKPTPGSPICNNGDPFRFTAHGPIRGTGTHRSFTITGSLLAPGIPLLFPVIAFNPVHLHGVYHVISIVSRVFS